MRTRIVKVMLMMILGMSVVRCSKRDIALWKEVKAERAKYCDPTPWGYSCIRKQRVYY